MTASDLVRQEVGEPRTCLPEDYERGDAAGKGSRAFLQTGGRTADGWSALADSLQEQVARMEGDAGRVLEKLQKM